MLLPSQSAKLLSRKQYMIYAIVKTNMCEAVIKGKWWKFKLLQNVTG